VSRARTAAVVVLGLRVAYGAGLVAAPERLARRWLGPSAATPPTQVPLRALGVREAILHAGAIGAALGGGPVRPWLVASIAGDLSDVAATVAARRGLPGGSPAATALVAGASAAISAAVAVALDD
jgi:hypothetical protein